MPRMSWAQTQTSILGTVLGIILGGSGLSADAAGKAAHDPSPTSVDGPAMAALGVGAEARRSL